MQAQPQGLRFLWKKMDQALEMVAVAQAQGPRSPWPTLQKKQGPLKLAPLPKAQALHDQNQILDQN